ncbi:MAG TPA: hypothetical protein VEO73_05955 [Gemmatimonadales bacterium]|nr:hypothetical protein [Gemmatimonadales bacterium]
MGLPLGRFIAIAVVVLALGLLTLRHRAQQVQQRVSHPTATAGDSSDTATRSLPPPSTLADSDSIAAVAAAVAALQRDDSLHGWGSIPVQVLKFERDSVGALVTLLPQDPTVPGGGALVRVTRRGATRLIERYR